MLWILVDEEELTRAVERGREIIEWKARRDISDLNVRCDIRVYWDWADDILTWKVEAIAGKVGHNGDVSELDSQKTTLGCFWLWNKKGAVALAKNSEAEKKMYLRRYLVRGGYDRAARQLELET